MKTMIMLIMMLFSIYVICMHRYKHTGGGSLLNSKSTCWSYENDVVCHHFPRENTQASKLTHNHHN